jgi:nicotinamidase-related amidase
MLPAQHPKPASKLDMASRKRDNDLHGNVPDSAKAVLLLVDVINDLDFPQNKILLNQSANLARNIARLKARCRKARMPCIYVNDNRDRWRSDFHHLLDKSLAPRSPGRRFVEKLIPRGDDYIILKPKHSAFFATPLETVLNYMGVRQVLLAGVTTNSCILGTAMELHVRDYELFVPQDCCFALSEKEHLRALKVIQSSFDANINVSSQLEISKGRISVRAS